MAGDLVYLGIEELSRGYRQKSFSPVDAVEAALAQIERENPILNAFLRVGSNQAMADARAADKDIRSGRWRGWLHGIPVSVKDLFFVRGIPTTGGSPLFQDYRPAFDSTVVARLKDAGAVIVGKTNLHELAYGVTNENRHFGACRNPWDPERISGGSSGGSAVSVAAGMSVVSYGTDTGGSIRIPASYCGVTGLKPTFGRISRHGVIPLSTTLDHPGSFGRSVRDAAIAAEVVSGRDPADPSSIRAEAPAWSASLLEPSVKGWVAGFLTGPFVKDVCAPMESAMRAAAGTLTEAGVHVEAVELEDAFEAGEVAHLIQMADGAAVHHQRLRKHPEQFSEDVRILLEQGHLISAVDYINAQRLRRVFQRKLNKLFDRFKALLLPATPVAAPLIGQECIDWATHRESVGGASTRLVRPFNLAGVPVLTVPCGFTEAGLPLGMQIVTRAGDELGGLQLGEAFERRTAWHLRRPASIPG
jgi:aspartyl-tRNA(Asn)/glutamyl-tRNA(Gln) amidotransferase subunit A